MACAALAATTARRWGKAARPRCSVQATSASVLLGMGLQVLGKVARWRRRAPPSLRADNTSSCDAVDAARAARGGASSSTTWALVPPMPNELTPARRGVCRPTSQASRRRWP